MDIIDSFKSELAQGDIRFRDNLQFELKSEFLINPTTNKNVYKQEFFIFIPATLQINKNTYSKKQFYLDQTNLIRYKTPKVSLWDLVQPYNPRSPLIKLQQIIEKGLAETSKETLDELQLFANIFRATIRDQIHLLIKHLENCQSANFRECQKQIETLCYDIEQVRNLYSNIQALYLTQHPTSRFSQFFKYTDEFVSDTIDYYLINLLKIIQDLKNPYTQKSEQLLSKIITKEQDNQQALLLEAHANAANINSPEPILYRQSLLNKFMLEALMLKSNRLSLEEKHGDILGAFAAGVAMFVYMVLFVWKSSTFVINSMPFVLLAVFFYILKDRLKEGLKRVYFKQAFRWFPDYSTDIRDRDNHIIGRLNETFLFVTEKNIPPDVLNSRNKDFHEELPAIKRLETIIHYKREVTLYENATSTRKRRREITTIFRLNIHHFLEKASNPQEASISLDKHSSEIIERLLPKVYHINIIILNTQLKSDQETITEMKKFRVVVDKFGIRRVEQIK